MTQLDPDTRSRFCLDLVCRDKSMMYWAWGSNADFAFGAEALSKGTTLADLGLFVKSQTFFKQAAQHFRHAIAGDPAMPFAHANLGSAMMLLGECDGAARAFEVAVEQDPEDAKGHYCLAQCRLLANNPAAAVSPAHIAVRLARRRGGADADSVRILRDYEETLAIAEARLATPSTATALGVQLRFRVGDRVECRVGPDGEDWRAGAVSQLWFREASWSAQKPSSPYQILLDDDEWDDNYIHAPADDDQLIRREQNFPPLSD